MTLTSENQIDRVAETARFLSSCYASPPEIGLFTGTGLGDIAKMVSIDQSVAYEKIPHFPTSTVESHSGNLLFGSLAGRSLMVMQGRFHLYEGYSAREVTFPVRVMQQLGIKALIVTNASGGVNQSFTPGDIMIIEDHINLTGENPLVGPNVDAWGDRFPDMMAAYDNHLADLAHNSAADSQMAVRSGVYAGFKGPSLETPAEVRYLQAIGADAVGFSTVMEVIAAVHAAIPVLGLSLVTNVHRPDAPVPATMADILETANRAAPGLEKIVSGVIESI